MQCSIMELVWVMSVQGVDVVLVCKICSRSSTKVCIGWAGGEVGRAGTTGRPEWTCGPCRHVG